MNTNEFIDTLEHELRLASRRRVRLAAARVPRPPAGAVAFTVALAVCAMVAVPLLATRSGMGAGHRVAGGGPGQAGNGVVVGCSRSIYGQLAHGWRSPTAGTVVAGPMALVGVGRNANPAAINRSHFIEALAVVSPGRPVTVSIPASERSRLALDFTGVAPRSRFYLSQGTSAVTFRPCFGRAVREFDGGFIVSHAQCAEVDVEVAGETTTIRREIPLGRPCPSGGAARTEAP